MLLSYENLPDLYCQYAVQLEPTTNMFIEMRLFIIYLASTFFVLFNLAGNTSANIIKD